MALSPVPPYMSLSLTACIERGLSELIADKRSYVMRDIKRLRMQQSFPLIALQSINGQILRVAEQIHDSYLAGLYIIEQREEFGREVEWRLNGEQVEFANDADAVAFRLQYSDELLAA